MTFPGRKKGTSVCECVWEWESVYVGVFVHMEWFNLSWVTGKQKLINPPESQSELLTLTAIHKLSISICARIRHWSGWSKREKKCIKEGGTMEPVGMEMKVWICLWESRKTLLVGLVKMMNSLCQLYALIARNGGGGCICMHIWYVCIPCVCMITKKKKGKKKLLVFNTALDFIHLILVFILHN